VAQVQVQDNMTALCPLLSPYYPPVAKGKYAPNARHWQPQPDGHVLVDTSISWPTFGSVSRSVRSVKPESKLSPCIAPRPAECRAVGGGDDALDGARDGSATVSSVDTVLLAS
jgi:hypothetical protein